MLDMNKIYDTTLKRNGYVQSLTLWQHLSKWLAMSTSDLGRNNASFLKTITTYVVRNFQKRRKGGVPVGNLDRFIYPADKKINLFDTLAAMIIGILRKRGVRELQERHSNQTLELLIKAYDRTPKYKENIDG